MRECACAVWLALPAAHRRSLGPSVCAAHFCLSLPLCLFLFVGLLSHFPQPFPIAMSLSVLARRVSVRSSTRAFTTSAPRMDFGWSERERAERQRQRQRQPAQRSGRRPQRSRCSERVHTGGWAWRWCGCALAWRLAVRACAVHRRRMTMAAVGKRRSPPVRPPVRPPLPSAGNSPCSAAVDRMERITPAASAATRRRHSTCARLRMAEC